MKRPSDLAAMHILGVFWDTSDTLLYVQVDQEHIAVERQTGNAWKAKHTPRLAKALAELEDAMRDASGCPKVGDPGEYPIGGGMGSAGSHLRLHN